MSNTRVHNKSNKFNSLVLNIRSLSKNFDHLLPYISSFDLSFDLIILTETWLSDSNDSQFEPFEIPAYSHISLNRTTKRGGGIRIYYKNTYSVPQ